MKCKEKGIYPDKTRLNEVKKWPRTTPLAIELDHLFKFSNPQGSKLHREAENHLAELKIIISSHDIVQ